MTEAATAKTAQKKAPLPARIIVFLLKVGLPVAVLAGAYFVYHHMMATAPVADRKPPARHARLVEVVVAERRADQIRIAANGVVMPALEVTLTPQVSGEVVEISENLVPGGRFKQGDVLLKIDSRDYENAVRKMEREVIRARSAITLEEGNQDVALREYEVLGQDLSEADQVLVFRKPQLEDARADLAAAEASVRDAKLDLERTTVTAPFDALVTMENVDLGSRLTQQTTIAQLVGANTYWVEISIPQADLRWVILPSESSEGSTVTLAHPKVWEEGATRTGRVVRLLPDLSDRGRMARLLVAVDDPLALLPENADQPQLLIGQYLEAVIDGREVDGAIRVPRAYLREGDNVWILNDAGELEVRALDVRYRGTDEVLAVSGIEAGERIVTTDLATGTDGMKLRTAEERPQTGRSRPAADGPGTDG